MKKSATLLAVLALAFITNFNAAFATGNFSLSDKKAALTILVEQVDRGIIGELKLNEMQYVYLKNLYKTYHEEVADTKALYATDAAGATAKTSELANKYFTALSDILTPQQINAYVYKQSLAQNN